MKGEQVQSGPRKAFVLAAGFGSRLRPLTEQVPKPLLELWGKPLLVRNLEMLRGWGVKSVLVNLHHGAAALAEYLAAHPVAGLEVGCVFEPEILGTGGGIRNAAWFFDEPAWVVNADVFADVDPRPIVAAWEKERGARRKGKLLGACWVTREAGPRTVRCERGRIADFAAGARGRATFCGLQIVDRRVAEFVRPEGFDTIVDAYKRGMAAGWHVAAVEVPGAFWADLGTPAQFVQAHRDTAARLGHAGEEARLPMAAVFTAEERASLAAAGAADAADPFGEVRMLPPRGSSRDFYRVRGCGGEGWMAVRWRSEREDNALYGGCTRALESAGTGVPRLFVDAPELHLLAMEDVRGATLEERAARGGAAARERLYRRTLEEVLRMHLGGAEAVRRTGARTMPRFGPETYAWEREYFLGAFAAERAGWGAEERRAWRRRLEEAEAVLAGSPHGMIHRDLQSSNVLFRGGRAVLIDYQGMREGPVAYDLASLLCDPYADLPEEEQRRLLAFYVRRHPRGREVEAAFRAGATERLCQALGAFATLCKRPGMARWADYIPAALRQLGRWGL